MSGRGSRTLLWECLVRNLGVDRRDLDHSLKKQAELAAGGRYYPVGRVLLGLGHI